MGCLCLCESLGGRRVSLSSQSDKMPALCPRLIDSILSVDRWTTCKYTSSYEHTRKYTRQLSDLDNQGEEIRACRIGLSYISCRNSFGVCFLKSFFLSSEKYDKYWDAIPFTLD